MTDKVKEQVLGWVDSMRDFDWVSGFQDSLDELVRIVGAKPKESDRPDYKFTKRERAARER